jgi:methionine-rich copper-binding protein CopC
MDFNWPKISLDARVGCLTALLILLVAQPVFAHARLVKSFPENTATFTASPAKVELWFNELLDDGFNSIEVFPLSQLSTARHDNYASGVPTIDPKDRTHLTISIAALKPGDYLVSYRVLSRDGHTAPGRISFHVVTPGARPDAK